MSRPKGYAAWNPQPDTLQVVDQVQAVLREWAKRKASGPNCWRPSTRWHRSLMW
jgi:hypothetical protein